MSLKKLYIICIVGWLLAACGEKTDYRVELKLSELEPQNIYAVFESADEKQVDTVVYKPGEPVRITREKGHYDVLTIFFENHQGGITVYLEPGRKITVTGDARYPLTLQIKGTRTNDLLSNFRKQAAELLNEKTELSGADAKRTDAETAKSGHMARLANINHELALMAEEFITNHPNEEASAILIQDYILDPDDPARAEKLIGTLSPKLNETYTLKNLKAYCARATRTMVGAVAPDFKLDNVYGETFTRDSFSGRNLVLAFTAAWCDLCKTEKLLLDKIQSDFRRQDVDVVLVSLDEDASDVRSLMKADTIHWNVFTDSAGQAIRVLEAYNVNSLPRCFLIDRRGTIRLKTDNGIELRQTLEAILGKGTAPDK